MKNAFLTSFFLFFLLHLTPICSPPTTLAENQPSLKIGTLTALTGYSAKQGVLCKDVFEIALAEHESVGTIQKGRVELVVGDSQRKAGPALSEFKRMTAVNEISAIVLSGSPTGMGINASSKRKKIPILGAVGHKDFLPHNPFAYGIWPSTQAEGAATAKQLINDGKKKIAIVSAEDEWNLSLKEGFLHALNEKGLQAVYDEDVLREEQDFSSYITRLRTESPDAIFVNLVLGNSGVFIKKLREQKVSATIYANYFGTTAAEMVNAGEAAEGVIGTKMKYDVKKLKKLLSKHGRPKADPNAIAFTCLATMELVLQAVEAYPHVANSEQLHDALLNTSSALVLGEKLLIKDRRAQFSFEYQVYRKGQWVPL